MDNYKIVKKTPQDGRVGDWIATFSGHRFWPADPWPEDVHFEDIAHALACENRFGGHLPEPYSVAQHCYHASMLVTQHLGGSTEEAMQALMHDAAEAYVKDIPRPLKTVLPEYRTIERGVWQAIATRFGIKQELTPRVKKADEWMLAIERRQLFPTSHGPLWVLGGEMDVSIPEITINFMPWKMAKTRFIGRYLQLTRGRGKL